LSYFKKIRLNNFRNFHNYENEFSKNCNVLFGKNGSGKTNILEGISLFSRGTGIRNDNLKYIIKFNEENFFNYGEFISLNQNYEIKTFSQKKNEKFFKKILINDDKNKETIDNFQSLLSFIIFEPEMERFFLLTPSFRRKFIDRFIYSYNKSYAQLINKYKKNIRERSLIIKSNILDEIWLLNIEENIAKTGTQIYKYREEQIKILNTSLNKLYSKKKSPFLIEIEIIDKSLSENPSIITDIQLYKKLLKLNRKIDSLSGITSCGPHRSDFTGYADSTVPLNQLSTGQQKTIVLLFILSQCQFLIEKFNVYPILLMDEVCSHLDETNRTILMNLLQEFDLQFFMTGTDKSLFSFLSTNTEYYNISN
tara:strand:+ start:727 stop:1824 length:1098 start_codon:yes stop_codon:yes gene_type:complete